MYEPRHEESLKRLTERLKERPYIQMKRTEGRDGQVYVVLGVSDTRDIGGAHSFMDRIQPEFPDLKLILG